MNISRTAFDLAIDRFQAFVFGRRSGPKRKVARPCQRTPIRPHACVVSRKVDGRWIATRIFPRWSPDRPTPPVIDP